MLDRKIEPPPKRRDKTPAVPRLVRGAVLPPDPQPAVHRYQHVADGDRAMRREVKRRRAATRLLVDLERQSAAWERRAGVDCAISRVADLRACVLVTPDV